MAADTITRFIFDTRTAHPKSFISLTHLGWALGRQVRQSWFAKATQ
jgi:hypothetical protein